MTSRVHMHWAVTDDRVSRGGGPDTVSLTGQVLRHFGGCWLLVLLFLTATAGPPWKNASVIRLG